jgi:hypothetical protein
MDPSIAQEDVLDLRRWNEAASRCVADLVAKSGLGIAEFAEVHDLDAKRVARAVARHDDSQHGFDQVVVVDEPAPMANDLRISVGGAVIHFGPEDDIEQLCRAVAGLRC